MLIVIAMLTPAYEPIISQQAASNVISYMYAHAQHIHHILTVFLSIHKQLRLCINKLLWEENKICISRAHAPAPAYCFTLRCVALLCHIHSMEINRNFAISLICNRLFIHMCSFCCSSYHFRFFSVLRHIA